MGFTRGMKRPIEILCKRLSSPVNYGHAYSTSRPDRGILFTSSSYCNPKNNCGIWFIWNYSSEVSASEQMNLIKQLRERTNQGSESALVACNWDIGAARI